MSEHHLELGPAIDDPPNKGSFTRLYFTEKPETEVSYPDWDGMHEVLAERGLSQEESKNGEFLFTELPLEWAPQVMQALDELGYMELFKTTGVRIELRGEDVVYDEDEL